ncbi:WcbI family polysaccharide biosynthesis putative acetyltransferase [Sphingomonas sp. MMS24-J13]|uniref:WcbI family polysaccharide biosynthesis putative acetyltransferase n=1 Tax=Sphingomonas sp. MMS24-J13 TaxID=3238686 RepID=UPI00384C61A6
MLVISNCQSEYLAPFIELALADCACDYLPCHEVSTAEQHAGIERHLEESKESYQLIIAIPLGSVWRSMSKDALISRFGRDRLFFIMNVYFSGTHPDLTMVGDIRSRLRTPMGDPHSRIALGGWMAGLGEDEILGLFNPAMVEKLGFLSQIEQATVELRTREQDCDTKYTDELVHLAKVAFSFYTNNHPTPNVLASYVNHIRYHLVVRRQARSSDLPMNAMLATETLAKYGIWPVYPELKSVLAGNFPVSTLFLLPDTHLGSDLISRETYVRHSIAVYEEAGREKVAGFRQAQECHTLVAGALAK